MAIVKEVITPNGVRVRIHDDCYVGISEEELAQRKRRLAEAILTVDRNVQLRELAAEAGENQK